MSKAKEVWRVNLHRAVTAMGSPEMLGDAVWKCWADDTTFFHDGRFSIGSQRMGEPVYDTEVEAWEGLVADFQIWFVNKRDAMIDKMLDAKERT